MEHTLHCEVIRNRNETVLLSKILTSPRFSAAATCSAVEAALMAAQYLQ